MPCYLFAGLISKNIFRKVLFILNLCLYLSYKIVRQTKKIMNTPKFELENGYAIISVNDEEVVLENIKVYKQRQGTGRQLVEMVKDYAIELGLPVGLYAEPQDETISEDDLKEFYKSCGFELDVCDVDGKLFIYE